MPDPSRFSLDLLHATADATGGDYLHALTSKLASVQPGCIAIVAQPSYQPRLAAHVLYSSQPLPQAHYPAAGSSCQQVMHSGQPLLRQQAPQGGIAAPAGSPWQAYAGWPLQDEHGDSLGVLALFSPQPLPGGLLAAVAPFARRASAELQRLRHDDEQQQRMRWHALHSSVLRQYLDGRVTLPALLELVVQQIERQQPDWLCTIVLLDDEQRMRPLATPSLPAAYSALLQGMAIGPAVGSCGAAAWHGQRVVAENLQQHPNWQPYRDIAARFGLGSCWSEPIIDSHGKVHGTFAVYQQRPATPTPQAITILEDCARLLAVMMENSEMRRSLDSRTGWYQAVLQNSADALSVIDLDGRFLEVSDSLCQMLGYSSQELLAMHLWQVVPEVTPELIRQRLATTDEDGETFDSVNRHRDGHLIDVEVSARRITLDGRQVIWGSARDIGERKALERLLREQACTDMLTGLASRRHFLQQLDKALTHPAGSAVLWMLDLDFFKQINDRHGHDCGDHALAHFAGLLRQQLPPGTPAGRLGGEEFAVLLCAGTPQQAQQLAEAFLAALRRQPLSYQQHTVALTVSIGQVCVAAGEDSRSLLARADQALYLAKHAGRDCCVSLP
ncbi:diguanylate cyclase domain-containing protein [Vogesella sp. LIG4]|uniref:sensor domain-containing diguanylate cyclase n=1 Tax=Vogesella sp. LIG4 TaxID=1192162 RepID=UPI00081FB392|nr:diguanylate cyclase [Vogesella sp. LIG4]SCK07711.1 PAS domain S-box-containing protein/diguanylate cyclase (GGDEF) domain-containing protein [Vogesella sp. LIG4]